MKKEEIIVPLAKRGNGEIYLGVVGAVRTGKSTFIKKFIENLIVPNITDEYEKKRYLDEMPQSASGKTIMTTEPKFVPSNGAVLDVMDFKANIKLIEAEAEAEANRIIAASITPELIQMKEAEARLEHGWVEVTGASTVVANEGE